MKKEEKIQLFLEIIRCSHPIYLWKYEGISKQVYTDYPTGLFSGDILRELDVKDLLENAMSEFPNKPFILENQIGLLFIIAVDASSKDNDMYILGPAFSGADSLSVLNNLETNNYFSIAEKHNFINNLHDVPIISSTDLSRYAIMLHYLLNDIRIDSFNDVVFVSKDIKNTDNSIDKISKEHRGIYTAEKEFLSLVKEGNPQVFKQMQKMSTLSSGMRVDVKDPVRNAKNNFIVLLTLVSRASIEGNLSPEVSYNLNDYYANRIESCTSVSEVSRLSMEMIDDYIKRNNIQKKLIGLSKPIRNACDYIQLHLDEDISIETLAKNEGYTVYYFSHKFKKEMNISVADYIKKVKIDHAKTLLKDSNLSINEIVLELGFNSRNHFFTSFKKATGMSPSEYRKNPSD